MSKLRGFTLIELMIVLAIMGILISTVIPGFRGVIDNNRITTQSNLLMASLNLARAESVKRNNTVAVCKSSSGTGCTSAAAGWEEGWLVFSDTDNDATVEVGETIVLVQGAIEGVTIRPRGGSFTNAFFYRADGSASGTDTFNVCPDDGKTAYARKVFVSRMKPRSSLYDASDVNDTCP